MSAVLTRDDVQALEDAGKALFRHRENELAIRVLGMVLLLRSQKVYACDVDESAGMADVVALDGYSRKAPCV